MSANDNLKRILSETIDLTQYANFDDAVKAYLEIHPDNIELTRAYIAMKATAAEQKAEQEKKEKEQLAASRVQEAMSLMATDPAKAFDILEQATKERKTATGSRSQHYLRNKGMSYIKNKVKDLKPGLDLPFEIYPESETLKNTIPVQIPRAAVTGLVAPTGHGKSTMSANLAIHYASQGKKVVYVSYEETDYSIAAYMFASFLGVEISHDVVRAIEGEWGNDGFKYFTSVDAKSWVTGEVSTYEERLEEYIRKSEEFEELMDSGNLVIVDEAPPEAELMELIAEAKADLVIVDYIQLVMPDEVARSRYEEIKHIMEGIHRVAKELFLPVIAIGQFNRTVNAPGEMTVFAIAESAYFERTCSLIIAMWNTDAKIPKSQKKADKFNDRLAFEKKGYVYVSAIKGRRVPKGGVMLPFNGNLRKIYLQDGLSLAGVEEAMKEEADKGAGGENFGNRKKAEPKKADTGDPEDFI